MLASNTLTFITTGGAAYRTCAVDIAGAVYCWGDHYGGDLGDDTNGPPSYVPVLAGPQAPAGLTAVPGNASASVS